MTLVSLTDVEEKATTDSLWLLRAPLALLFAFSGITKMIDLEAGRAEMAHFGLPELSVFAIVALQLVGAIALITGWGIRITAIALALFVIMASFLAHSPIADGTINVRQSTTFVEHLVIVGALLVLTRPASGRRISSHIS